MVKILTIRRNLSWNCSSCISAKYADSRACSITSNFSAMMKQLKIVQDNHQNTSGKIWRQNVKGCPEKMLSLGNGGENSFPARKGGVETGYDQEAS